MSNASDCSSRISAHRRGIDLKRHLSGCGHATTDLASPIASPSAVEKAGWRRYCRRYGCGPDGVAPDVQVDVDVDGADVSVDADVPAVVVLPPPRPLSCGQYGYWNGTACVDARYNNPYIGPR